jgi:hypothetical protein
LIKIRYNGNIYILILYLYSIWGINTILNTILYKKYKNNIKNLKAHMGNKLVFITFYWFI